MKEKESKFFAFAFPIQEKAEVKDKLAQISKIHPKARHICTAYLLGEGDSEYYQVNDDGEPGNSAGMPILGAIRSAELTNVLIAVVRYFGGTKLGFGGLVSAYRKSASMAIEANEVIEIERMDTIQFQVSYQILGEILSISDRNNLKLKQEHLNNGVVIQISCKLNEVEKAKQLFERYNLSFS